jgi:hypothetical protein
MDTSRRSSMRNTFTEIPEKNNRGIRIRHNRPRRRISPFNLYIDRLTRYADRDKVLYAKIKEKLDKYPVEGPDFADIKCNAIEIMAELDETRIHRY